jgi:outer membrane receptor for ferrienterochelin and colicins
VRVDRHSEFGTAVSPKIAASARAGGGVNLRASYGRGFRAPDLGQLYYRFLNPTNFYQVVGNPNLSPEYANSLQIGGEYMSSARRVRAGVNFFRNDVRDLIESVNLGLVSTPEQLAAILAREGLDPGFRPVLGRQLFTYKNVNDAATSGVEVDGEAALGRGFALAGAYTYLDALDAKTDRALTGRNRHQGNVRVSWRSDGSGTRASLRSTVYSSWIATRSGAGVDTVAPGFTLIDAYLSQRIVRSVLAFVAADNLADSQDPNTGVLLPNGSPAAIYRPEIGRTLRFGVRWSWNR